MSEENKETKVIHEHHTIENDPNLKVEITKGQRGGYGWTISYEGKDSVKVLEKVKEVDKELKKEYEELNVVEGKKE